MVVILGAGLAGLSAAYNLDDRDVVLVERESEVGGLCRSKRHDGFVFDFTGHLLHLRDPTIRDWVLDLLPDGYCQLDRSAWIHSHDLLTPYPFQANTAGLPLDAPGWAARDALLLRAVDELHADSIIADPTWKALSEQRSTQQLLDLVFTVGQYNLVCMALNTLGVQLDPGLVGFPR